MQLTKNALISYRVFSMRFNFMRKQSLIIALLYFCQFLTAQQSTPAVGIPTFVSEVEVSDGSLLLLGEAAEQGFSQGQSFRVVDRRRLDAVFLAREEVRHEDYLASDRESIQAIGADYLLIGRITQRELIPAEFTNNKGVPARSLRLTYQLTLSLIEVANSQLIHSENMTIKGSFYTELGEPEMRIPLDAFVPKVEQHAANQLSKRVRNFAREALQGGMQMVDVIHQKGKRIEVILVASTMKTDAWDKIKLYVNEYYEVAGDTLTRPAVIGEARIWRGENRLFTCKVTEGDRELKVAYDAGQTIYAVPNDQSAHWLGQLMFLDVEGGNE